MKLRLKKIVSLVCCFAVVISIMPQHSFAALTRAGQPSLQKTFVSSQFFSNEKLSAEAQGKYSLNLDFSTPIQTDMFKLSLYRIGTDGGDIGLNIFIEPEIFTDESGNTCYRFSKKLSTKALEIPDGSYYIYLRRAVFEGEERDPETAKYKTISKNVEIRVREGSPYIAVYRDVRNYNDRVRGWADNINRALYLDNSLEDIRFVLRDPLTRVYAQMYQNKQDYIKSVADRICSGAKDDYEKIKRLYEYTANNFYYDIVAFREKALQYADPYQSIYNFENKLSAPNSQRGIVHITCQGYSAIFIALARSQGIPSRLVFGHHLSVPSNNWTTEEYKMSSTDHWWAEAYVAGRWVMVDCTTGTTNQYNKSRLSLRDHGLTNYTLFDPSLDMIAMGHVYKNIYPDFRRVRYLTNPQDIATLREFFIMNENGRRLNSKYNPQDLTTWGDGIAFHSFNDGWGNILNMLYKSKGLSGEAVLSNLKSLSQLDLRYNKFTSIDLSGSNSLSYAKVYGNPLTKATICIKGVDRKITSGENGTFSFNYLKARRRPFILYSKPDLGYKVDGLYNLSKGTKATGYKVASLSLSGMEYELRFKLDPDSYKKTIFREGNQTDLRAYVRAAAKRLSQLGYYNPYFSVVGNESYYTSEMAECVYKFQVVNGLNANYNIDEETWKKLFSDEAVRFVGEDEYRLMLEAYLKAIEDAKLAEAAQNEVETTENIEIENNN